MRAITAFGGEQSKVTLLHIGAEDQFPTVHVPPGPWPITPVRQGNPVTEIVSPAAEMDADLLIMVSAARMASSTCCAARRRNRY